MNTLYAIKARQQCELLVAFSDLSAFKRFAQDPSEEQLSAAMAEYYELVGDIVAEGAAISSNFQVTRRSWSSPRMRSIPECWPYARSRSGGTNSSSRAAILVASWLKFISGGCAVVRSALATTSALTYSVTRSVSPHC